jgi:hypothetical protein
MAEEQFGDLQMSLDSGIKKSSSEQNIILSCISQNSYFRMFKMKQDQFFSHIVAIFLILCLNRIYWDSCLPLVNTMVSPDSRPNKRTPPSVSISTLFSTTNF